MKYLTKILPTTVVCLAFFASSAHSADQDMKAMMKAGQEKMMSMPMTGAPDMDFVMMMREHHMGALTMAEWELKNGKDAGMRELATKIIAAQKKEIAQFDQFLAREGHR